MSAKLSVFIICVEMIIYLLLNNLYDCTFNPSNIAFQSKCIIEVVLRKILNPLNENWL